MENLQKTEEQSIGRSIGERVGPILCGILVGVSSIFTRHFSHLLPFRHKLDDAITLLVAVTVTWLLLKIRKRVADNRITRVAYPAYVACIAGDLLRDEPRVRNRFAPLNLHLGETDLPDTHTSSPD